MYYLDEMIGFKPARKGNGKYAKGHTPWNKGKKWAEIYTDEQQQKIRAARPAKPMLGKKNPNAGRKKHAVIATNAEGKEYWFESTSAAERTLSINRRDIINVLNGRHKSTHGYQFKRSYQIQH